MRLPCERYVRLLLAGTWRRHTLAEVAVQLVQLRYLPAEVLRERVPSIEKPLTETEVRAQQWRATLELLRDTVEEQRPKPYIQNGQLPWCWLADNGLLALAQPDEHARQAVRILQGTGSRPLAEVLLIASVPPDQAAGHLTNTIGDETYSTEAVTIFRDWFWDRGALTEEDWIDFLLDYPSGDELLHSYLSPPWYTLLRIGAQVDDVDLRSALEDLALRAYARVVELGNRPLPDRKKDAQMFRAYAATIIDVFRETGGAARLTQLLEQMKQLGMRQIARSLPAAAEIEQTGAEIIRALAPAEVAGPGA